MIRTTIEMGETFHGIVVDRAKLYLKPEEVADYVAYCAVISGDDKLPNMLFPGSVIEIPTKSEWARLRRL